MTDRVYRVRQLISKLEFLLLSHYNDIEVEGELSTWTESARGHCYFSLKEEPDILPCVLFSRYARKVKGPFQTGDMVRVRGNLTVYGPRGNYQLLAQHIEKTGEGDFYREFLRIKERLEKEGIFRDEHKKALPPYPGRIGVITSARGAAVQDIINIIRRRNPYTHIILRPTVVQGEEAVPDLVHALEDFENFGAVDVIIIGRGGGSLEDLWAFNEEKVARAVFRCPIPVISAVGHQNDIVITDLAADYRAETPSAAAEKVTENFVTLLRNLQQYSRRLDHLMRLRYQKVASALERIQKHPYLKQPHIFISKKQQVLDDYIQKLDLGLARIEKQYRKELAYYQQHFRVLSPSNMISRRSRQLLDYRQRMHFALRRAFISYQQNLTHISRRLFSLSPLQKLRQKNETLSYCMIRMTELTRREVHNKCQELSHYRKMLDTTNPFNLLKKGYTIIYDKNGSPVKRSTEVKKDQAVDIRFYDGKRSAKIEDET